MYVLFLKSFSKGERYMAYQDDDSGQQNNSTEVATTNGNAVDKNGGNKQKNISVEISTLFSHESKAILKISIWYGKLGFEFSKPDGSEGKSPKRAFFTMDYEKAIWLSMVLNSIARERVMQHKNGTAYTDVLIPIEQSYIKDGELHKVGTLYIKTIPVKSDISGTTNQRICISYESVGEIYDVVLASKIISKQVSDKWALKEVDADDARFFLLCRTLESTVNNLPTIAFVARLADIIFARPNGGGNNNGGAFPKKEWNNKFPSDKPKYGGGSSAFGGDRSSNRTDDVETIAF